MPSDSLLHRVIEQVEGSHYSFIRFVGKVCRHEWDWAPDDGIPSARDVVAELCREEVRLAAKLIADHGAPPSCDGNGLATPSAAATTLRGIRETTIATLRRHASSPEEAITRAVAQAAVSLAQLDAHALGSLVVLQRLIDPSRAAVSPR